jgi:prevent-host-death family protein
MADLTSHVHVCTLMDMSQRTSASRLKARLGQYLRAVRAGGEVVVTDREQPVARIVPWREPAGHADPLPVASPRDPAAPFAEVEVRPIRYRGRPTTRVLLDDRKRR